MGTDRVQKGTGTPILTISEEDVCCPPYFLKMPSQNLCDLVIKRRLDQWCAVTFTKWQAQGKLPASVLTQLQSLLMGDRYTLKMETGTVSYGCETRLAFSDNSWLQNSAVWVWGAERFIYFGIFLFIFILRSQTLLALLVLMQCHWFTLRSPNLLTNSSSTKSILSPHIGDPPFHGLCSAGGIMEQVMDSTRP